MSATRTQVYLTQRQRQRIDEIASVDGLTMAEVIRRALDAYLDTDAPAPSAALAETFGSIPDTWRPDRDEWARG